MGRPVVLLTHFFPFPTRVGAEIRSAMVLRALAARGPVALAGQVQAGSKADEREAALYTQGAIAVPPLQSSLPARLARRIPFPGRDIPPPGRGLNQAAFRKALHDLGPAWDDAILWLEAVWLLSAISRDDPRPIVLDQHNVDSLALERRAGRAAGWRRQLYSSDAEAQLRYEKSQFPRVARFAVVSGEDASALLAVHPAAHLDVIPNAVDTGRYHFLDVRPPEPVALMTGHFGYEPNAEGAAWLAREVWPSVLKAVPGARLHLAGMESDRVARALSSPSIVGSGEVAHMAPVLQGARVAAVPIFQGGGSRLKVLEAIACGVPVVATSVGCEGIAVNDGEHLLVRDEPAAFAAALASLLEGGDEARDMRRRARALVEERYSEAAFAGAVQSLVGLFSEKSR